MAKKATPKPEAIDDAGEKAAASANFTSVEEVNEKTVTKISKVASPNPLDSEVQEEEETIPSMTDPTWSDYVIRQFENDELDPRGNPCVSGLRRVARLLLGQIVESYPVVLRNPDFFSEHSIRQQPAVVEYHLKFLWCKDTPVAYEAHFADVADVTESNTDPDFARFRSATASTRAEARCYRKALNLNRVSSEEMTSVPLNEPEVSGKITPTQINFMDIIGRRNDVDLWKYINSGKQKFDKVTDVDYKTAEVMTEHLSGMATKGSVAEAIKGYKSDWRNT